MDRMSFFWQTVLRHMFGNGENVIQISVQNARPSINLGEHAVFGRPGNPREVHRLWLRSRTACTSVRVGRQRPVDCRKQPSWDGLRQRADRGNCVGQGVVLRRPEFRWKSRKGNDLSILGVQFGSRQRPAAIVPTTTCLLSCKHSDYADLPCRYTQTDQQHVASTQHNPGCGVIDRLVKVFCLVPRIASARSPQIAVWRMHSEGPTTILGLLDPPMWGYLPSWLEVQDARAEIPPTGLISGKRRPLVLQVCCRERAPTPSSLPARTSKRYEKRPIAYLVRTEIEARHRRTRFVDVIVRYWHSPCRPGFHV
jgi:hypothetical protein